MTMTASRVWSLKPAVALAVTVPEWILKMGRKKRRICLRALILSAGGAVGHNADARGHIGSAGRCEARLVHQHVGRGLGLSTGETAGLAVELEYARKSGGVDS